MNRRRLISLLASLTPLALFQASAARAQAGPGKLKSTPQDALGPFYPPQWSGDVDNDLLTFSGKAFAAGTPLALSGRVLSTDGSVLVGAQVEIWQTDHTGKYRHPGDDGEGPARRGFQGFGRTRTDAAGNYAFRTIKPVYYSSRPPHIHFKVAAPGHRELVTQMYFVGENVERGMSFAFSRERDVLTVKPTALRDGDRDGLAARFDLVLERT